jgi:putative transcriptional regulator
MTSHLIKPKQGIILISEPSLRDFYFRQSVVLLAEHNDEGTFGVIINKPIETKLSEVIKDFPDFECTLYLGGPVQTDSLFFIHTLSGVDQSLPIIDGLYWGGNIETIKTLILNGELGENEIRFFIGYSGWHPNQLDNEIKEKSWVLSHTTVDEVIHAEPQKLWSSYLKSMGDDYAIWANFPTDPSLN